MLQFGAALVVLALSTSASGQTGAETVSFGDAMRQRILWVVPDFSARDLKAPYRPMTPKDKFFHFTDLTFDRYVFATAGFDAAIAHATDSPEEYDRDVEGFGKRYGLVIAGTATNNFLRNFTVPVLFNQDPRYYRLREGSTLRRALYAFSRTVIARDDRGNATFNWADTLGTFATVHATNTFVPGRERDAKAVAVRTFAAIGMTAGFNLVKEFWPELKSWVDPDDDEKPDEEAQRSQRPATIEATAAGGRPAGAAWEAEWW